MAQLLRRLDDEVYVEYNRFGLDGTDLPAWGSPVASQLHGTTREEFLPRAWDHLVASDGTTRRV
ncbi:hypothetical protein ACIBI7_54555, partial [Nonomuraea fuscirosea]|uniref:hypothetical protein n=1 Tax=Nonomuraea fuscirosea TaxID=1291556 RepID=UPI0037873BBD